MIKRCPVCLNKFATQYADKVYCDGLCKSKACKRRLKNQPIDNVSFALINKKRAKSKEIEVRKVLMFLLSKHYTVEMVGKILGRDHTTVIYGRDQVADNYEEYQDEINKITHREPSQVEMCNKFLLRRKA